MKRIIAAFAPLALLLCLSSIPAEAAPVVGPLAAVPAAVTAGTPTDVTFTSTITDPLLLANGVNLIRTDAAGKSSTIVGIMHDDGINGDAVAGNKTFSLSVHVNASPAGATYYRVSAAFRGVLQRTLSPIVALQVTQAAARPSVAAQDDARSSSAAIGEFGGSVSTTAADGTVYSLTVPAGALNASTTITITPVTALSHLPFSGPNRFAVRLGPSGLQLARPATLTIQRAAASSLTSFKGLIFDDDGSAFEVLPISGDADAFSVEVAHFSAAGAASTNPADFQATMQPLIDALPLDLPPTQVAPLVASLVAWLLPAGGGGGPADFSLCSQTTICGQVFEIATQSLEIHRDQACAQAQASIQAGEPFEARLGLVQIVKIAVQLHEVESLATSAGVSGFDETLDLGCVQSDIDAIIDLAKTQSLANPRPGILSLMVDLSSDSETLGFETQATHALTALQTVLDTLVVRANTDCLTDPDVGESLLHTITSTFSDDFLRGIETGLDVRVSETFAGCRIRIDPPSASVTTGKTVQFSGTAVGLIPSGVAWSIQAPSGGSTIDPGSGLFTAGGLAGQFQIVATSAADSTRFKRAPITIVEPVTVSVTPGGVTLTPGAVQAFTAAVSHASNPAVTWTAGGGTIDASGVYTAGTLAGTFTVRATSVQDPAAFGEATVTIQGVAQTFLSFVWQGRLSGLVTTTSPDGMPCLDGVDFAGFTHTPAGLVFSSIMTLDPSKSTGTQIRIAESAGGFPTLTGPLGDAMSFTAQTSDRIPRFEMS